MPLQKKGYWGPLPNFPGLWKKSWNGARGDRVRRLQGKCTRWRAGWGRGACRGARGVAVFGCAQALSLGMEAAGIRAPVFPAPQIHQQTLSTLSPKKNLESVPFSPSPLPPSKAKPSLLLLGTTEIASYSILQRRQSEF